MPLTSPNPKASKSQLISLYKELQQQLDLVEAPTTSAERKQEIMNLLHEFNEVKDAAQIVIGKLANLEGKTIKQMHLEYNLPLNE